MKSTAIVSARGLTIVDGEGRRFAYAPKPELDSRDGNYLGYYSAEARQFLIEQLNLKPLSDDVIAAIPNLYQPPEPN